MSKKTWAGAAILAGGVFLGREFFIWLFNQALDAASAGVRNGVSFASISWLNAAAVTLVVVGATLLLWPKPKAPSKDEGYIPLYNGAVRIIKRVRANRKAKWFNRDRVEPIRDIAGAGEATMLTFLKAGFVTPTFKVQYVEQAAVGQEAYFSAIIQLLGQGHYDEAMAASGLASERAERLAEAFNPHDWFQDD